ncbi:T9SS type A sorting domain-containing protein [Plebeiibacterium sediminum]|uniref:T9SS type A sorting domain-containing protein n=1 Tax=Plebeiibacterium sediminum TaxID=2992112 RepID=A0AAE3M5L2_9BACT|nr:T9SS type A sorting domain-containing protein [Plebeiobacterium sediminum]MCW3787302.1 T9SS type A sorting domain-containing protein [Plebeiobacterium sediminum]
MSIKHIALFVLTLIISIQIIRGQVGIKTLPISYKEDLQAITSYISINAEDSKSTNNGVYKQSKLTDTSFQFATSYSVNLTPLNSGIWHNTPSGKVWRLGIYSKNAYSLYITCNTLKLEQGVSLFLYSNNYKYLKGPFGSAKYNKISFPAIMGDTLFIELNVPPGMDKYGNLVISKVYHDFTNIFKTSGTLKINAINNNCIEDINDSNGKLWQTEKRAVCKIVSDGQLSTGTLIGNTSETNTPYILTASHTMFDSKHAAEAIYYFNDEFTDENNDNINESQFILGGELVASSINQLDFSLIQLASVPPPSFRTYYAGWNRKTDSFQGGTCIHHAWGHPKQIAIDYHTISTSNYNQQYDSDAFWHIAHWETGFTSPGSSGAPLFNSDHQIIGTLTGGQASCENPVNDYFCQFGLSWDKYPDIHNQLKHWLDPDHKNKIQQNGYDPYGFNSFNCDTTWNFNSSDKLTLNNNNLAWGYYSGHNSDNYSQFAEKFYLSGSLQLPGIFINPAKAYASHPLSHITIKVWEGKDAPEVEKYSQLVFIKDLKPNASNYIGFNAIVSVSGNFFIGYQINKESSEDSLAVYHTLNPVQMPSSMFVYDGQWHNINQIPQAGFSANMAIGIIECYGKVGDLPEKQLSLYPNPCTDHITVKIPENVIVNKIDCFDITGKVIPTKLTYGASNIKIKFSALSGTYFIKIQTNKGQYNSKFIISNHICPK